MLATLLSDDNKTKINSYQIMPRRQEFRYSLLDIVLQYVTTNLNFYELDALRALPNNIKCRLLKKFTSTCYFSRNVSFQNILTALVNKEIVEIDLTSVLIKDETLVALNICQNMKSLYLSREGSNCKFTSKGLLDLLANCKILRILVAPRCASVDDQTLKSLSENCRSLEGLDIGGSNNISDIGLASLRDMNLKWLRISRTKVTDKGIIEFVRGASGKVLQEFVLSNCCNVTNLGVFEIIENCPNLTLLDFPRCYIDSEITNMLSRGMPIKQLSWQIPL